MSKRKRIRVKVSELLKKIESKSSEPKHISEIIPDALTEDQRKKMIFIAGRSLGRQGNLKWLESAFITGSTKDSIPESVDANACGKNIHESWQDSLARLELEMDAKSVEEIRTTRDSIVTNPKFGAMIYCGTGGNHEKFNEAKELFYTGKYPYSEEEYKRIINQGFTK